MSLAGARPVWKDGRHETTLQGRWFQGAGFLLLASAVVLGSGGWSLRAVALALMGWLVLSSAAWLQWRGSVPRWGPIEWIVAGLPALLLVAQTLPLPPSVIAALAGRALIQTDLELAGAAEIWRPLTLDVSGAFRAVAAMLPAAAMLVCVRGFSDRAMLDVCRWLVGLAGLSVLLGLLQVLDGPDSVFRLHDFHNLTGALGFFAYRNHQAAFLLLVIPVAVALLLTSGAASTGRGMSWRQALLAIVIALLLLGLALTFSRAGLVLGLAMLCGCTLLAWSTRPRRRGRRWAMSAAAGAIGVLLLAWLGARPLVERLATSVLEDGRWNLFARVSEIALKYQPVGAGLGSFEQVFQGDPQNVALMGAYMNHAHNEWLQLWLELGWFGALIGLAALAVLGKATWSVWRKELWSSSSSSLVLARAASVSLLIGAIHAYFDYALRSGTNMVVFALLAALLLREGFTGASAPLRQSTALQR